MIINNKQIGSFVPNAIDSFAVKVRKYICENYPEHVMSKKIDDLDHRIKEVIKFAFANKIKSEINILNLVILFMDKYVPDKFSVEQLEILKHSKWSEDKRTEEFYLQTLLFN
jgi:hypothetical protein